jgi:serine protease
MRIFLRTRIHAVLFILAFFALITVDASATIRHVPADYPTIQQAIDAAVNGDTVLVAPGTYVENISFLGKAITVTSESGAQSTLIDGHRVDSVVRFTSQEGPSSVLNGFTITNGAAEFNSSLDGGGIRIVNSSPTIINNIITNNIACDAGAGIYALFSSPIIRDNIIADNKQSGCIGGPGGSSASSFL